MQHPSFGSWRFANQPLTRRERAALLAASVPAERPEATVNFGPICLPTGLDMKSRIVTPSSLSGLRFSRRATY